MFASVWSFWCPGPPGFAKVQSSQKTSASLCSAWKRCRLLFLRWSAVLSSRCGNGCTAMSFQNWLSPLQFKGSPVASFSLPGPSAPSLSAIHPQLQKASTACKLSFLHFRLMSQTLLISIMAGQPGECKLLSPSSPSSLAIEGNQR